MAKKIGKVLTKEEKFKIERDHELNMMEHEIKYLNEPTYKFNIGEEVSYGNLKNCIVEEILNDGKVYVLKCISTENNYGNPIESEVVRVVKWCDIRPLKIGDTHFTKEANLKLDFYPCTIESLLYKYYCFGIDMNPSYQRDYVWSEEDKEYLLDSIFNNIDIGKFALIELEYGKEYIYEILDGKQRLKTLVDFYENRISYKGKYYNDLSYLDRATFKNLKISIAVGKDMKEKDIIEYFIMLNTSGKTMDKKHIDKIKKEFNI